MITVFTCDNNFEAMLTCIYDAWCSRLGHNNVRLEVEPIEQYSLFERYVHVEMNQAKASEVVKAVNDKISPAFYSKVAYSFGACEKDTLNTVYRVLVLGFKYGAKVLDMRQFEDIQRFHEISGRYEKEAYNFLEFTRFHKVGSVYVAHLEPKSHILLPLAEYFSDRMPSEYWIIVDDVHGDAVIHQKDCPYYLRSLSKEEFERLQLTESENDTFTAMWQQYVDHIAIQARNNYRCQLNHFPKWKRKHAVEFQNKCY